MKKLQILFLFLLATASLSAQKSDIFQDTIPFRNDLGLIIIPMSFNGVEKQFAFDTGAQKTLAYGWSKKELKATRKTMIITSSTGQKSKLRFYKSGVIALGSRKVRGHRILHAPDNEVFTCHRIDGILGVDIIQELNWKIDYKNKILIMYPPNHVPEYVDGMHALDFDYSGSRPYVFLKRKKARLKFLLDTGAGGSSNISTRNYTLTDIEDFPQTTFADGNIDLRGVFTPTKPKVMQFPEMVSKDVKLFPVIFYNDVKSTKIGNRLWKDQSLFLNLKSDRLWVSSSSIQQNYSGYSCSVMFQNRKMRIVRVEEGSEIWNAGVRQGDEVLRYDGKAFSDFCSLDQYRRDVLKKGGSFTVELTNGKTFTVSQKKGL